MKTPYLFIAIFSIISVLILQQLKTLETLELKSIDQRFYLRSVLFEKPQHSREVVIIGIDDKSIAAIEEPFILWDTFFAQIITTIARYQPRVMGLDIIWAKSIDKFLPRPPQQKNALKKAFLLAVNKHKIPVVIGIAGSIKKGRQEEAGSFDSSLQMKHFGLILGKYGFGVINTLPDRDKVIRRVRQLFQSTSQQAIPSFAFLIASKALEARHQVAASAQINPPATVHWINYQPALKFQVLSFVEVLEKARANDAQYFSRHFHDKIVLFGINNVSEDIHATPLVSEIPGIFIHAQVIQNYLDQNYLQAVDAVVVYLLIILLGIITALIASKLELPGALLSIFVVLCVYMGIVILSFYYHYIIPLVPVVLVVVLTFVSIFIFRFTVEDRNKRRLAHFFRSYVNDQVVDDILKSDKPVELEGSRQKVCVLFSDIRNFTTYSESHDPEVVVRALNEYFSHMTEVILKYGGTVDKFIGDGLMAFFGAPIKTVENPSFNAVLAALEMREQLGILNRQWQQQGLASWDNGIGLHTGEAIIGNIGSYKKMEYTAIGDAVNIASRIEGLTKSLNAPILVSKQTYEEVTALVESQSKGIVAIKGHSDIEVFEVMGIKSRINH